MNITIRQVDASHPDAVQLEEAMQQGYVEMYGEPDQDPDNAMSGAYEVLVAYDEDGWPLGITAWSVWPDGAGKIRLMYVDPQARGERVAEHLLRTAEHRMVGEELSHVKFETGPEQHAAMRLYERAGYVRAAEGFGYYAENEGSVFYEKWLR